ncbi:hypothetical protein [Xanthomonas sp. F4]
MARSLSAGVIEGEEECAPAQAASNVVASTKAARSAGRVPAACRALRRLRYNIRSMKRLSVKRLPRIGTRSGMSVRL